MWVYNQELGLLWKGSKPYGPGYAGNGVDKNNHDSQWIKDHGPLPVGLYKIQEPRDTESHGPYVLPLEPVDVDLRGRAGFLIHGDSIASPGEASKGCIIIGKSIRQMIWASGDHDLQVVP